MNTSRFPKVAAALFYAAHAPAAAKTLPKPVLVASEDRWAEQGMRR